MESLNADFILLGHTHVQGMSEFDTITVVNPGSVGLARDHQAEACYAIYQNGQVTLKSVPYDFALTIASLEKSPLPNTVITGLASVLRPKC